MCRLAIEDGAKTIVATPHWEANASESPAFISACKQKLDRLQQALQGRLSLELGFLMKFSPDLDAFVEKYNTVFTLGGGRCLLVTMSSLQKPEEARKVWKRLKERGYSVLLSRPECNLRLRRSPQILIDWSKIGVHLQLDSASITGAHGREVQRFAWDCLKMFPNTTVIASGPRRQNQRAVSLGEAREQLAKKNWTAHARRLLWETPARIINSQGDTSDNPDQFRRRSTTLLNSLRSQKSFSSAP